MKSTGFILSNVPAWLVPLSIIFLMTGLVHSPFFILQPERLSLGITVDLVLTAPLLYWLIIRHRSIPNLTVLPWLGIGVVVASMILPDAYQNPLTFVKTWFLPMVELTVLAVVVTRVRRISIDYRRTRTTTLDFYTALQHATAQTLPRVVALVLTAEVAAFYYGFLVWRKRKPRLNEFSYHRTSGSTVILITIMFLVVAETVVIHLLLMRWSPTIAVVLTAVSAYTVVQLLGLIRAIRQRPITVDDNYLTLRYGFLQEATVPMSSIASITEIRGLNKREGEQILSLSPLGALETPNVLIRLSRPAVMQTMYGSRKAFATISFYVDEPEQLRSSIDPVRSAI